ncbi:MAG: hypothetical protein B6245_00960 [Desulfobacteraceae bacterium 4572_88]|nr:MAG: hypothetical protein B6245_00960 [Desulfobacteraceae bacterium 4572_88]RLC21438.1 MAG: histone acetyltransferase [Deltaproteobacteria bacterium]
MPSEKPFIIPVFIPHAGCLHQCAFCNQAKITSVRRQLLSSEQFRLLVEGFLNYKGSRRKLVQIAFYGGTFLGLEKNDIERLLREADRFVQAGKVDGIRFSTRPDTVDQKRLDIIRDFPVSTIELGVQSMDDRVLKQSRRGHTAADTERAFYLLREQGYEVGMQMMVGLPGENHASALDTGKKIAALSPDMVRIYPTVVIENSPLARWYRDGKYMPLPLDACVTLVKQLYLLFQEKNIRVIRMGLQASEDFEKGTSILAGPYHPAFGHMIYSEIFLDILSAALTVQNIPQKSVPHGTISIRVHPRNISKMRGMNNKNIDILKRQFHLTAVDVTPDDMLGEDAFMVQDTRTLPQ